MIARLPG
jgi:hypothetical protein